MKNKKRTYAVLVVPPNWLLALGGFKSTRVLVRAESEEQAKVEAVRVVEKGGSK